jgi:hypothetical protein
MKSPELRFSVRLIEKQILSVLHFIKYCFNGYFAGDINNTGSTCSYELFLETVNEETFCNMNWQLSQVEFYV